MTLNPTVIRDFLPELVKIRRHLHSIPEIGLSEFKTSDFIAGLLESWGYEVERGFATTGLVATLRRGSGNKAIAFRADMDALPIAEETDLPYASQHEGVMHACGHDGHSAMLLGAAYALAHSGTFDGRVNLIFQPAEENFGGAKLMIEDGLFERYPSDLLFALHNMPGLEAGRFSTRPGPIMASIDAVTVSITGKGGHGAQPEETIDPVVAASSVVMALQSLISRNASPHAPSVLTVGQFHAGTACNIIPDTATLDISMRAIDPDTRAMLRKRTEDIVRAQAQSFGAEASFDWQVGYPPTINDADAVSFVEATLKATLGADAFDIELKPMMGSEDCAFFLEKMPGAYVFIGNGQSSALHTSTYDFNDAILENGAVFFCVLAEKYLDGR